MQDFIPHINLTLTLTSCTSAFSCYVYNLILGPQIRLSTFDIPADMDKFSSMDSQTYDKLVQESMVFRIELVQKFENVVAVHDKIIYK